MGEIKNYTLPNTKPTCVRYLFKIGYVSSGRILRQKQTSVSKSLFVSGVSSVAKRTECPDRVVFPICHFIRHLYVTLISVLSLGTVCTESAIVV